VPRTGGSGSTTGVASDWTEADPPAFVAVTTTRIVSPTSSARSGNVPAVAHQTTTQLPPPWSHRAHSYAYELGSPIHSPVETARLPPSTAAPETTGGETFAGDGGSTASVGGELASFEPPAFMAVTTTRRRRPSSAGDGPYVEETAPNRSAHVSPSADDCHWKA
jgi:hypothetical protein